MCHVSYVYNLPGTWREMMVRPSDLTHSICFYDSGHEPLLPLIPSDVEILEGKTLAENRLEGEFRVSVQGSRFGRL